MEGRHIRRKFALGLLVLSLLSISAIGVEYTSDYWFQQGKDFLNKGSYEVALDCYNKSLDLDPKNAVAWNDKGVAL